MTDLEFYLCLKYIMSLSWHVHCTSSITAVWQSPLQRLPYLSQNGTDFVGFIPDLIYRLSQDMGFEYEIHRVLDGKYGSMTSQGTWNGMIGEVVQGMVSFSLRPRSTATTTL